MGAIAKDFKSSLVECPFREDSDAYQEILEGSQVFPLLDSQFGKYQYLFMQDSAPCHVSRKTISWLSDKTKLVAGWPPNSPDLNPIEMVWAIIKHKLPKYVGDVSIQGLKLAVRSIWQDLRLSTTNALVADFRRRLELVKQTKGESISAFLSSHTGLGHVFAVSEVPIRLFSEQEDQEILAVMDRYGCQCGRVMEHLATDRPEMQIRVRIIYLLRKRHNDELERRRRAASEPRPPFVLPILS